MKRLIIDHNTKLKNISHHLTWQSSPEQQIYINLPPYHYIQMSYILQEAMKEVLDPKEYSMSEEFFSLDELQYYAEILAYQKHEQFLPAS